MDIDAFRCYTHAIKSLDMPEVKAKLEEFQADHKRHVEQLSELLGQPVPKFDPDAKGVLFEGMVIAATISNQLILRAMRQNEQTTNRYYQKALTCGLPENGHSLV
jgi:rubrerythrin